ncbi:hypothetical protein ACHAPU_010198 [Fusarium lateritium]
MAGSDNVLQARLERVRRRHARRTGSEVSGFTATGSEASWISGTTLLRSTAGTGDTASKTDRNLPTWNGGIKPATWSTQDNRQVQHERQRQQQQQVTSPPDRYRTNIADPNQSDKRHQIDTPDPALPQERHRHNSPEPRQSDKLHRNDIPEPAQFEEQQRHQTSGPGQSEQQHRRSSIDWEALRNPIKAGFWEILTCGFWIAMSVFDGVFSAFSCFLGARLLKWACSLFVGILIVLVSSFAAVFLILTKFKLTLYCSWVPQIAVNFAPGCPDDIRFVKEMDLFTFPVDSGLNGYSPRVPSIFSFASDILENVQHKLLKNKQLAIHITKTYNFSEPRINRVRWHYRNAIRTL